MEITKEENQKLQLAKQIFKVQELTKEQAEFTLGRKLTDRTWQQYATSQKRKHKNIEDNVYCGECEGKLEGTRARARGRKAYETEGAGAYIRRPHSGAVILPLSAYRDG